MKSTVDATAVRNLARPAGRRADSYSPRRRAALCYWLILQ